MSDQCTSPQEYGRWISSGVIPRTIFLKLEQEVRCTLWVPEPNQSIVLLRTGLLRHLDRYMLQLRILPPTAPKTIAEMDAEEAAAEAVRREEEAAAEAARRKEAEQRQQALLRHQQQRAEAMAKADKDAAVAREQAALLLNEAMYAASAAQASLQANGDVVGPAQQAALQQSEIKMQQAHVAQQRAEFFQQRADQLAASANGVDDSPEQGGRKKRGRPKDKRNEPLDPEAEKVAAEAAKAKAAAEAVARKEARDAQYAIDYKAFTDSMAMYESLQQDAAHQQLSKQVIAVGCRGFVVGCRGFVVFCGRCFQTILQWMGLREEIRALNPVQRYRVASIAYRRCLNQSLMSNLEDTAADPASWPVCWLLLEPAEGGGVSGEEVPPCRLAVPLHVDANLPDFMVVVRG